MIGEHNTNLETFSYFEEKYNLFASIVVDQTSYPKFGFEIHSYLGDFVWGEVEYSECLYKTRAEAEADCIERLYSRVKKFKLNGKIFTLNKADGKYYSEDGNWANYIEWLDKNNIIEDENRTKDLENRH